MAEKGRTKSSAEREAVAKRGQIIGMKKLAFLTTELQENFHTKCKFCVKLVGKLKQLASFGFIFIKTVGYLRQFSLRQLVN